MRPLRRPGGRLPGAAGGARRSVPRRRPAAARAPRTDTPARLTPAEVAGLARAVRAGDRAARERLIAANLNLVRHVVRRYRAVGADGEELFQVGCVGLIKAVDRFDPERGTRLSTYAVPLILGEIQRHLRDLGPAGLGRDARRLLHAARAAEDRLHRDLRRAPTAAEVAAEVGVSAADLAVAMEAARRPASLDEPAPGGTGERRPLGDRLASPGRDWDHAVLRTLIGLLPPRQRQVVFLRYFRDLSQAEVGGLLGLSQPQISRLETRALAALRQGWREPERPSG